MSDLIERFKAAFADSPEFQKTVKMLESQDPVLLNEHPEQYEMQYEIWTERPTETPFERLVKLIDETKQPHIGGKL
jgi:hypothetical protein